jgi:hypothetical protein
LVSGCSLNLTPFSSLVTRPLRIIF